MSHKLKRSTSIESGILLTEPFGFIVSTLTTILVVLGARYAVSCFHT